MMGIRRLSAVCVALVVSASFAMAQQAPKKDEKKRSKQEQAEIEQLVKLVDGVMAARYLQDVRKALESTAAIASWLL